MTLKLRTLQAGDIPRIVALNDAAHPAVPITPTADMAALLATADFTLAAVDEAEALLGFVIGMRPGSPYESENYRYFESRGGDYLYVDRIVVDEAARGAGVGRMLYAAVFDLARSEGRLEVTCEVNVEPPNPVSLAFHARMGFERVGEQPTKGGSVIVALLAAVV